MQIEKNSFISFKTFFAKSQKRHKETDKLRFRIGKKIFADLLPLNKITRK